MPTNDTSKSRKSLQEFADEIVAPQYRQPLQTAQDVVIINGWQDVESPVCCGEIVTVESMLGSPYHAECRFCGKFARAVDGPNFTGGAVQFLDPDKVDLDTEHRWIVGVRQ